MMCVIKMFYDTKFIFILIIDIIVTIFIIYYLFKKYCLSFNLKLVLLVWTLIDCGNLFCDVGIRKVQCRPYVLMTRETLIPLLLIHFFSYYEVLWGLMITYIQLYRAWVLFPNMQKVIYNYRDIYC